MSFQIDHSPVRIPSKDSTPIRGAGDMLASFLAVTGAAAVIKRAYDSFGIDCRCPQRQAYLNRLLPFQIIVFCFLALFATIPAMAGKKLSKPKSAQAGIARDSHGRIKRSLAAKKAFEKMTGFPHGRPGFVVDHVIPLKEGGLDAPSNMQWQTIAAAKAKDKWE